MKTEQELDRLATDARARITWGESTDDVREWLADHNVPDVDIETIISDAMRERALEFRKRGLVDIVLGTIITAGVAIVIVAMYPTGSSVGYYYFAELSGPFYLAEVYGLYRIARGIWRLVAGSKSEGSLANP